MAVRSKVDDGQYNINEERDMSEDKKSLKQLHDEHYASEWASKNWRAWGSWFSWGSPVGLSIFLLSVAGIVWIFMHT